jgi:hypothetical protein
VSGSRVLDIIGPAFGEWSPQSSIERRILTDAVQWRQTRIVQALARKQLALNITH